METRIIMAQDLLAQLDNWEYKLKIDPSNVLVTDIATRVAACVHVEFDWISEQDLAYAASSFLTSQNVQAVQSMLKTWLKHVA